MATPTPEITFSSTSKICRLCAKEYGPFLNIFGTDMDLSSKIRDLLPFEVDEWDDLPHKICFLCSAKVTELHTFVSKCIESQTYFHEVSGKPRFKKTTIFSRKRKLDKVKRMQQTVFCNNLAKNVLHSLESTENDNCPSPPAAKRSEEVHAPQRQLKELKIVLTRIDESNQTLLNRNEISNSDIENVSDGIPSAQNSPKKYEFRRNTFLARKPISIRKSLRILSNNDANSITPTQCEKKMKTATDVPVEDNTTDIVPKRKHPYLLSKNNLNTNSIYPCITEKAVVEHLHRLKMRLNMKYESLELAKKNGMNWVCLP